MAMRIIVRTVLLGGVGLGAGASVAVLAADAAPSAEQVQPWMTSQIVAEQASAPGDEAKEAVANRRAKMLLGAMTMPQKMQQLTGSTPELLPELPQCFGARHVRGIASLAIPTLRISNGPVGVGQNDCVSAKIADEVKAGRASPTVAYTHPTSAKATVLPSAMAVAASFDPEVATKFGDVIANEMNALALHVFEAPGVNLARLPILGRNFEYFGEDPYLTGVMAVAETRAIQRKGLIAMVKHYAANEQETNRQTIQETVDRQVLRELYLLPFEMAIKDGKAGAVMCAYNYVNGASSCESRELLTDILRRDWGFSGYVQSDFFAMKSTAATLKGGMDHEMPLPLLWAPAKLYAALAAGELTQGDIDLALERRYTQTFKLGIFDRKLVQSPIDYAAGGHQAREIGGEGAVLLQNNGSLPLSRDVRSIVLIGKASQVYAQQAVAGGALVGKPMGSGGGSSDVVPNYTVSPIEGLRNALHALGNASARLKLVLVDDANASATIDGAPTSFAAALAEAGTADAVVMMAGTISEEGADRATFATADGKLLAANAALGSGFDWYAPRSDVIAVATPAAASATSATLGGPARVTLAHNSQTSAMIQALLSARSSTPKPMWAKSVIVLKDNAGVALDPSLVGANGPALLEVWFPGQEDGNIVADLLLGRTNPSGKLPVTFPYAGKGFLNGLTAEQFPGVLAADGKAQTVSYDEKLHIGYRWYDANVSGKCKPVAGRNPCVAFPFGHGLSYAHFSVGRPRLARNPASQILHASLRVTNIGKVAGSEVIQAYVTLPSGSSAFGAAQPPRRLVGFQKVELAPGASQEVTVDIDPAASHHPLSIWDAHESRWVMPAGRYTVWLGRSSSASDLVTAGAFTRSATP